MPQPTFHMMLASQLLDGFADHAPFDAQHACNRNAFLHGSIGPDMGFFPGANRLISQLAHATRTGDLVRALAENALTERQLAFTYGWVTHLIADAVFHPFVNRLAASLQPGASADASNAMHIRIEIGLDLYAHGRCQELQNIRLSAFFGAPELHQVADAFDRVHGVRFLPATLESSHRRAARFIGPVMAIQGTMRAAASKPKLWSPNVSGARISLGALEKVARLVAGAESEAVSFLQPHSLLDETATIENLIEEFLETYLGCTRFGLANFPNYDVHNGGIITETGYTARVQLG